MKTLFRILVACAVVFLIPRCVFPWGATEHKVIALIAWENLDPETRKAAVDLMLRAPSDSQVQVILSASNGDPRVFFVNASVWADLVRARVKYSCPLWHYAEFAFGEPGVEVPDLPAFKPRHVNVMERLQFFQNAFVDENEPISNRAVELVWTLHLVGDIHQPLHIATRVTKMEPESDIGGNKFRLGRRSLHAYWDLILASHYPRGEKPEEVYLESLADMVTKKYPRGKLAESLARMKPEEWADESFKLAQSDVYSGVTRGRDPSAEYERRAMDVAQRRIALAGYRLAQMLNRLFGPTKQLIASKVGISENAKRIKARLDYDLACVASTLDEKTRDLVIVKGTALNGQAEGQQVQGFNSDEVKRIINETKEGLLESLAGEELAGLRAYALKQFPDANELETFRVSAPRHALLVPSSEPNSLSFLRSRYSYHTALQGFSLSPLRAVNSIIGQARDAILGTRRGSKPISLQLITHPQTGANIVLQAPGGKRYATSTNSHINDFWPGTYSFTVTRDGSITVSHSNVDLGFGNSVIDCPLVNSGTPVLCQFR